MNTKTAAELKPTSLDEAMLTLAGVRKDLSTSIKHVYLNEGELTFRFLDKLNINEDVAEDVHIDDLLRNNVFFQIEGKLGKRNKATLIRSYRSFEGLQFMGFCNALYEEYHDEVEAIPEEQFIDEHSCDKACMILAHKSVSSLTVSELVGATMQHAEIVNTCSTRIKSLESWIKEKKQAEAEEIVESLHKLQLVTGPLTSNLVDLLDPHRTEENRETQEW